MKKIMGSTRFFEREIEVPIKELPKEIQEELYTVYKKIEKFV